jgi:hypothetical protein
MLGLNRARESRASVAKFSLFDAGEVVAMILEF